MPAVVPLITGAFAVYAAHKQGQAQDRSVQAQLTAERESLASQEKTNWLALDAEKQAADRAEKLQLEQREFDREAQRLAREDYLQRQSPYINMGNQAFGRLSELLNIPGGNPLANLGGQTGGGLKAPSMDTAQWTGGQGAGSASTANAPRVQSAPMQATSLSGLAAPSSRTQAQPEVGAPSPSNVGRGVRMVAPTGEVGVVPYDKVAQAITAGARRVS